MKFRVVGPIATVAPARVLVRYPIVFVGLFRVTVLAAAKLSGELPNNWPLNVSGLVPAIWKVATAIAGVVLTAKYTPPRFTGLFRVTPPATVVDTPVVRAVIVAPDPARNPLAMTIG